MRRTIDVSEVADAVGPQKAQIGLPGPQKAQRAQQHAILGCADSLVEMNDDLSGHSMKPGVELLEDVPGGGAPVEKKVFYDFRLRMWLSRGDPIRWSTPWGL